METFIYDRCFIIIISLSELMEIQMKIKDVSLSKIEILENVRTRIKGTELNELMNSIKQDGLKQPIGVYPAGGKFCLVFGHRRYMAFKKLGYKTIPASIESKLSAQDMMVVNVVENIQRRDISVSELGRIVHNLMKLKMTPNEIASRLSVPTNRIKTALNVYSKVPKHLMDKVAFSAPGLSKKGNIPACTANYLVNMENRISLKKKERELLYEEARKDEMSTDKLRIVFTLVKDGMSVKRAIKECSKFKIVRVDTSVLKSEVIALTKKHKMHLRKLITGIMYGDVRSRFTNPLKR